MNDRSKNIARVRFLGAQRIEIGGVYVTPESERLFAMIVRLSVPLGRMTSRQTMMDTLWPGADDANARHNLRQTVYKARELGLVVESGEDGLRLDPRHWSCDWDDPVGDVSGQWLPEYEPEFSEDLRSWIGAQRISVHALIRPRLIRSLQTARSAGELALADRHAMQLLEIDELNEEATLTRAELLAMQGAKVDALKLLDAYLKEIGRLGSGKDAALPSLLLRRRIAEKLPAVSYNNGSLHHGALVGRCSEAKRLIAGLFDARAGRGAAILVHGSDGTGKSRLLHEVKKSAVLQGMLIVELTCESTPSSAPFASLRLLARRLLEQPGAIGIAPEALHAIQAWLMSGEAAPDDCPLAEIEDLLASVSEETPMLVLIEHAERMDVESLGRLDRVYRRGVLRHHLMVLTSSTLNTPTEAPVALSGMEQLALRPMSLTEVRSVVSAYAAAELPRATEDQIACAAVFAEGNPMYGIEMLGLILDPGSPDVIPWRVQVAVEKVVGEMSELERRILVLCDRLGGSSRLSIVEQALALSGTQLFETLDKLEVRGLIECEPGNLRASRLVSQAAKTRVRASILRLDSLRAAAALAQPKETHAIPGDSFTCLRMYVAASEEFHALNFLHSEIGSIVRSETAEKIVYELTALRSCSRSQSLNDAIDSIVDTVSGGAHSKRPFRHAETSDNKPRSLPDVSRQLLETEYTMSSASALAATLSGARNVNLTPAKRQAEAVMALSVAFNRNDAAAMNAAYQAVLAVRHAADVNPFDVYRADLIYYAFCGARNEALQCAELLAQEARVVRNIELACKGFRNSAEAMLAFGRADRAQSLLHESRDLAARLGYHSQVVWADMGLADIRIASMDSIGADAHLTSASERAARHSLSSPLLLADLALFTFWTSLLKDDVSRAQKAAKAVERSYSMQLTGTPRWAKLGVRLATHRGRTTRANEREFEELKASIGTRTVHSIENFSLAALLLHSKQRADRTSVCDFVRCQLSRLEETKGAIWPFLLQNLA